MAPEPQGGVTPQWVVTTIRFFVLFPTQFRLSIPFKLAVAPPDPADDDAVIQRMQAQLPEQYVFIVREETVYWAPDASAPGGYRLAGAGDVPPAVAAALEETITQRAAEGAQTVCRILGSCHAPVEGVPHPLDKFFEPLQEGFAEHIAMLALQELLEGRCPARAAELLTLVRRHPNTWGDRLAAALLKLRNHPTEAVRDAVGLTISDMIAPEAQNGDSDGSAS